MAQREYKGLSCRDVGVDCDFMVRAETEEEVLSLAGEHASRLHNISELTPDLKDRMRSATKSFWCIQGFCTSQSQERDASEIPIGYWD